MKQLLSVVLRPIVILAAAGLLIAAGAEYPIPKDTVIMMLRGNCEGGCPVYRIVIFADGDVLWQGRARVARSGVLLSHIDPDQVRTLIDGFRAIDYLHLENIYDFKGKGCQSSKPDMAIVITSFAIDGESKTLMHHDGCVGEMSDKLSALENKIDKVVNTAPWISGEKPAS